MKITGRRGRKRKRTSPAVTEAAGRIGSDFMAIIAHIEENEPSPVALSKHSCPLCSYEWWEMTDAADYPYYCPGCGESYSPLDSEVYTEVEADNEA